MARRWRASLHQAVCQPVEDFLPAGDWSPETDAPPIPDRLRMAALWEQHEARWQQMVDTLARRRVELIGQ